MARQRDRLSARTAQTITAPGMYPDGAGLYLRIGPTGAKSWIYRYRNDGRRHDLGLGPYPDISLADARERAGAQRRLKIDGQDPLMVRRSGRDAAKLAAAKAMTFRQCAEAYINAHRATWKNLVHAKQWPSTLGMYVYPAFGDLPVAAVDTGLVMKAIEPIWTTKAETASRVRGRIESVLGWATTAGYRQGDNPARWRGHLENLLPAPSRAKRVVRQASGRGEHQSALAYADIGSFMTDLRQREGVAARALEFAILTATRTSEVIRARWNEFNMAERVWTIPGDRMKAGREHRVPLSDRAVELIGNAGGPDEPVFALSNMAMLVLLQKRMGRADLTVHGFRSTFRDWAAERTAFPHEVAEMALAHTVSNAVERAYRRGDLFDKRRQIMDAWARFCAVPAATGQVVAMRASKS